MTYRIARSMRILILLCVGYLGLVHFTWAQDDAQDAETPAPVADLDDLEPAVDVGGLADFKRSQASPESRVMDTLNLGTTSVTGSQELPKVLYIVPWKQSNPGDVVGRPVNTLLDEVLAPVDPEEFERHLEYYDALFGDVEKE